MERVTAPYAVEMGLGQPWVKRLKYTTVAELIGDYEKSNAEIGRTHCPVLDHLKANVDRPLEEVEAEIYSHPQWGPPALCETMWKTLDHNNAKTHQHGEFIARWVQHFVALELVKHPFDQARHAVSEMLKEPAMRFVSPEASKLVLDYLVQGHPNPGRFLAKPEVGAKFPGIVPTDFPAPDFD